MNSAPRAWSRLCSPLAVRKVPTAKRTAWPRQIAEQQRDQTAGDRSHQPIGQNGNRYGLAEIQQQDDQRRRDNGVGGLVAGPKNGTCSGKRCDPACHDERGWGPDQEQAGNNDAEHGPERTLKEPRRRRRKPAAKHDGHRHGDPLTMLPGPDLSNGLGDRQTRPDSHRILPA